MRRGRIEVICGSMFSGKTEELIRRMKRAQFARQRVLIFKPALDVRYSEQEVVSHEGKAIPSTPVDSSASILLMGDDADVVGIDEAQFFDAGIVDVCQELAARGVRVIVAGLDLDFRCQPFGPMPALCAVADDVLERLGQVSASELAVPLGTLTGSPLLAGRGPKLTVKMETMGTAAATFRDKFTAAGINQTKHQILLDVDVYVTILLPGITTYTKVSNEISVAETVIVGSVPQTYTYFSTTEDKIEDYADEYIMNNG